jgi:Leucine-rich repeat (LRR) protein
LAVLQLCSNGAQSATKIVTCEQFKENHYWGVILNNLKTCLMDKETRISSDGFELIAVRNESVKGLTFGGNRKIRFLPESPSENFPNLEGFSAGGCSIKDVSRKNFKNLDKLKVLWLSYNQIETIKSETFKDLIALEEITLREIFNKIHDKILIVIKRF